MRPQYTSPKPSFSLYMVSCEHSFETFPYDVTQTLRTIHKLRNVEARIFPRFDTKGDPTRAVNQLCNWLLLNAAEPEYESCVILGHSMGGLMVVDAYRKIYGLIDAEAGVPKDVKHDKEGEQTSKSNSWFGALGSWWPRGGQSQTANSSAGTKEVKGTETGGLSADSVIGAVPTEMRHNEDLSSATEDDPHQRAEPALESSSHDVSADHSVVSDALASTPLLPPPDTSNRKRPPVNIISIITFDTPFFGLHSRVYTAAAGSRAANVISNYVPPMPSIPAPPIPIGSALQAIPQAVGAGVQAGTQAVGAIPQVASQALRYSARAVGSIPEATQGLVGALPGAVAALPGAATQGLHMSVQAVTALPGATLQLGSSALQSVAYIPSLFSSKNTANDSEAKGDATVSAETDNAANSPQEADTSGGHMIVAGTSIEEVRVQLSQSDVQTPKELQDESVVFAAAVAAATVAVEHAKSEPNSPVSETPPPAGAAGDDLLPSPAPAESSTNASASAVGLLPLPQDTDWTPWVRLGLAGAAIAAGAYYSGGLLYAGPVVRRVAVAYALSHAEEARQHLQFLYPLWGESTKALSKRIEDIKAEVETGRIGFKCFFVELPLPVTPAQPVPVSLNPTKDVMTDDALKKTVANTSKDQEKTVIAKSSEERLKSRLKEVVGGSISDDDAMDLDATSSTPSDVAEQVIEEVERSNEQPKPPKSSVATALAAQLAASRSSNQSPEPSASSKPTAPQSTTAINLAARLASSRPIPGPQPQSTFIVPPPQTYCHLFRPVSSDCSDEIAAHMNMFSRELNAGPYWGLVDEVSTEIVRAVKRANANKANNSQ
ncbi:hypothetical protein, variant [Spizellomyces punctatus DAOM BR117]|uniref:AB hydrolase-1 domain-containing protein n=1 Tax=Spizellomyces punctatus (strain DAOM BR117) TaxID=645134 RepID=A0A0L0HUP2_SPIPD|nr:hypothetical protein, variant [Spizellomyces punctatus DAOM BR117]KND04605.1 hypothetical protein, variant [Spizellomyces punctatus DAOM BR117]|eukprot:XP_016612644.1 hypothetical protein, variant [Spizellomyces punctatus DAOM BR117]